MILKNGIEIEDSPYMPKGFIIIRLTKEYLIININGYPDKPITGYSISALLNYPDDQENKENKTHGFQCHTIRY